MISFSTILFIFLPVVIVLLVVWRYRAYQQAKKKAWMEAQKYTILHILVPRENEKGSVAAEQMFASLHGIFKPAARWQEQISLEIVTRDKFIHFYAHVPTHFKDFLEGQIYAQYPTVEISEVEDYSYLETSHLKAVGCELVLNKNDVYPIKTFVNFEVDPLSAITSVLAKVNPEEQIWIQIIIRPVSDDWQRKGVKYVTAIRNGTLLEGKNFLIRIFSSLMRFLIDLLATATGPAAAEEKKAEVKLSGPQEAALKGIEEKITKLGFATKIRLLLLAGDEYTARAKTSIIAGVFKQFNTTNLNGFEPSKLHSSRDWLRSYQKRAFYDQGYILNIEELASLFHLPSTSVATPNIVWTGSKKGEPPADLPIEGTVPEEALTVFAKSDFRHLVHRFGIKKADRRLHMYAVGKTGTGKSTMLENMIIDDIRKGRGLAVVDPHGDLINHVMNFIPSQRVNEVVYFNPADRDWPIGFNVLENVDQDLKNIVASGVVGIFKKIFGESWGPRLEYILRNTILALLEYPNSTLLGVMKILTDKNFRKKVVDHIKDPVIKDFFLNEYEKYDPKFRTEAIAPIQNKVGQFLSSSTIRNIVGQPKSTINLEKIMNEGKILLLDLSIGKIGEDNSALLGAMMITKIQLAAMRRTDIPEEERRDFYLYVDEFQNFATESFAVILSEARKYRLNLIMTNQFIAQMNETVAKAVFGNVGSIVSFRVGPTDASFLAKEFEPVFEPNDLVNLDNYHVYIKMAINGVTRPAFSAITLPPSQGETANLAKIIRVSQERYAKSRSFVEEKIQQWSEEDKIDSQDKKIDSRIIGRRELTAEPEIKKVEQQTDYLTVEDNQGEKWFLMKGPLAKSSIKDLDFTQDKKRGESRELRVEKREERREMEVVRDKVRIEEKREKEKNKTETERSLSKNEEKKSVYPEHFDYAQYKLRRGAESDRKSAKSVYQKKTPDAAGLKALLAPILEKKFQAKKAREEKTPPHQKFITTDEAVEITTKNQPKIQQPEEIQPLEADKIIKLDKGN